MHKTWKTDNGKWEIVEYESSIPNHRRGWLINIKSGNRYVWNVSKSGRVNYMKQPSVPTNIPKYLDRELINGKNQDKNEGREEEIRAESSSGI